MTICVNCGVELDDGMKICPLCGNDPGKNGDQDYVTENYPSDIIRLRKNEKKKFLWELSGVIAFSGIVVCTFVDLLTSKGLQWSLFSDIAVAGTWLILTLFRYTRKRLLVLVTFILITILAALLGIDLLTKTRNWFLPVGVPVTLAAFFAIVLMMIIYRAVRYKGLNIIAAALMILSGFCMLLETALDLYLNGELNLRWSLITVVSVFPVALVFIFYHYRLQKGKRLDSLFHI